MKLRRSSLASTKGSANGELGYTLVELMVSSTIGLVLLSLILGTAVANRNSFRGDLVRSRANETARGIIDIIAANVRLGGENLGSGFPAIVIDDAGTKDTLTVRRNLLSEVLPLCSPLAAGTNSSAFFAIPGNVAGCTYSGQTTNFQAWRAYRLSEGGTARAFIWDSSTRLGEFFTYQNDSNDGTSYAIQRSGTWTRAYPSISSSIYMLEEWRFRISGENLELVTNQDFAVPAVLAFGVTGFEVSAEKEDGTLSTSFPATEDWTTLRLISSRITLSERQGAHNFTRAIDGYFFPRNVLSN